MTNSVVVNYTNGLGECICLHSLPVNISWEKPSIIGASVVGIFPIKKLKLSHSSRVNRPDRWYICRQWYIRCEPVPLSLSLFFKYHHNSSKHDSMSFCGYIQNTEVLHVLKLWKFFWCCFFSWRIIHPLHGKPAVNIVLCLWLHFRRWLRCQHWTDRRGTGKTVTWIWKGMWEQEIVAK
jgi:hypothetical protein